MTYTTRAAPRTNAMIMIEIMLGVAKLSVILLGTSE
jgi:hypothetical protein